MVMLDERKQEYVQPYGTAKALIRTGCLACRAQGIRCDANNKQCQQNSSAEWRSNRQLEKYRDVSIWSSGSNPGILSLNVEWQGTIRERESLHFFCKISAPELSGFLDAAFWQRFLPQATHLDNAIKHAVAAIGAAHEFSLRRQASRNNAETDGLISFALRQCNKAINSLIRPSQEATPGDLMRTLTASILFASFESLNGNREGAVPHVVHSRRLLEQYKKNHWKTGVEQDLPVDLDTIEPLVAHYECQIGDFAHEEAPVGMMNTFSLAAPLDFTRLADARVSLEQSIANFSIVTWSLRAHHSVEDLKAVAIQKLRYSKWLQKWEAAFALFLETNRSRLGREALDGCRLLKAHHTALKTLVDVDYSQGEVAWAAFTPRYNIIVDLISTIVDNLPKRGLTTQAPQLPYLSATMGMTEPLYCTASRCADHVIAGRARALMQRLPLNEGIHSSWRVENIEKVLCAATGKPSADCTVSSELDISTRSSDGCS